VGRPVAGDVRMATGFRPGCTAQAGAVAINPSGGIVAAGGACGATVHHGFALARYTPSGALDPSFGAGGKVTTNFEANQADYAADLAIAPSGDIVAVGAVGAAYSGDGPASGAGDAFALARYTRAGPWTRRSGPAAR
jgi:hypothetical protein